MKIILIIFICLLLAIEIEAISCNPPSYLNAGVTAQIQIDSLRQCPSPDTLTLAILLHNQAFYTKNKDAKKQAGQFFSQLPQTVVVQMYQHSLRLMDIRDQGKINKLFGVVTGGLIKNAREHIHLMSKLLADDPANDTLLFLHSSAIIEAAEHLPEFIPDAQDEINRLRQLIPPDDTVKWFFIELIEAKYFFKRALTTGEARHLSTAKKYLDRAKQLACDAYHVAQIEWWDKRIKK